MGMQKPVVGRRRRARTVRLRYGVEWSGTVASRLAARRAHACRVYHKRSSRARPCLPDSRPGLGRSSDSAEPAAAGEDPQLSPGGQRESGKAKARGTQQQQQQQQQQQRSSMDPSSALTDAAERQITPRIRRCRTPGQPNNDDACSYPWRPEHRRGRRCTMRREHKAIGQGQSKTTEREAREGKSEEAEELVEIEEVHGRPPWISGPARVPGLAEVFLVSRPLALLLRKLPGPGTPASNKQGRSGEPTGRLTNAPTQQG
ncbi:uncharacterized protein PSFLO_04521 [Pseudozyma flocculosa]|uniref:Uncharacterized protein n=1 Tax=Pseudozyma flocculosa TaxID=84751 RepID=A0A5C3F3Z7_9BASI|nr:uncharacterized protein PSFLO_04521 [Pseudozyma flocculosa]